MAEQNGTDLIGVTGRLVWVQEHPPREESCDAVGRYLSALVTQVAEPCEEGADLESRLARLTDSEVRRLLTTLEIACSVLGVRP